MLSGHILCCHDLSDREGVDITTKRNLTLITVGVKRLKHCCGIYLCQFRRYNFSFILIGVLQVRNENRNSRSPSHHQGDRFKRYVKKKVTMCTSCKFCDL